MDRKRQYLIAVSIQYQSRSVSTRVFPPASDLSMALMQEFTAIRATTKVSAYRGTSVWSIWGSLDPADKGRTKTQTNTQNQNPHIFSVLLWATKWPKTSVGSKGNSKSDFKEEVWIGIIYYPHDYTRKWYHQPDERLYRETATFITSQLKSGLNLETKASAPLRLGN